MTDVFPGTPNSAPGQCPECLSRGGKHRMGCGLAAELRRAERLVRTQNESEYPEAMSEQNPSPEVPPLDVYVDRARERYFSAAAGTPPTDEQREASRAIGEAVVALAVVIDSHVPTSRNKSLAQTALEDVQMRANRAIYATGTSA